MVQKYDEEGRNLGCQFWKRKQKIIFRCVNRFYHDDRPWNKYNKILELLKQRFKKELFEIFKVTNNPKANELYRIVEYYKEQDYINIYMEFDKFVMLIKENK